MHQTTSVMGLLNLLFGNNEKTIKDFQSQGAVIIDVRTVAEFKQGAIKGSKNIPLQILSSKLKDIKKLDKPVITCCASGVRSGRAATILKREGIPSVNGGGWKELNALL